MLLLFYLYADLNPPEVQNYIQRGLNFAYVESFESASAWFDSVIINYPNNPAGWFFKAALIQVYMMDACRNDREKEYYHLIDSAVVRAERNLNNGQNPWALYYLGSSYTYRAVYEGVKKNYWTAFSLGLKGGKILKRLIELYPEFYDAYLGAGSFDYFWARASHYLPVLKLVGDFNKGIEEIKVARDRSIYSQVAAQNALVWIYTQEKNFVEGIKLAEDLLTRYSNSRTFLWSMAGILTASKNHERAIFYYQRLYNIYDSLNEKNYANLAQTKLCIARSFFEIKKNKEARQACDQVISFYRYHRQYPQIIDYVNEAKRIKRCL
ncbi:MAG: hypothetical protein ABIL05_01825 [candidate division WOR-3 bacterium]